MVYPKLITITMNNIEFSSNMILAEHNKAVVSSHSYQQTKLDEGLHFFTDDLTISDDLFQLFPEIEDPMPNYSLGISDVPQSCFNSHSSTCAVFPEMLPNSNQDEFSPASLSSASTGSLFDCSSDSQDTFSQPMPTVNDEGAVQSPTRTTLSPKLDAKPSFPNNFNNVTLLNPSTPCFMQNPDSYQFNNLGTDNNFDIGEIGAETCNVFLLPIEEPNDNNIILSAGCRDELKLEGSVSPLSNESGYSSPSSTLEFTQSNNFSNDVTLDSSSLFHSDIQDDYFSNGIYCSSTLNNDLFDSAKDYKFSVKSNNDTDIKPFSVSNKNSVKCKSSLHSSIISGRKMGRPKLSVEEKQVKKKESDRKAAQRYRAKIAQEDKNKVIRQDEVTKLLQNKNGQLSAYTTVFVKSIVDALDLEDCPLLRNLSEEDLQKTLLEAKAVVENVRKQGHGFSELEFTQ